MFIELLIIFIITFFVRVVSVMVGGGGLVLIPMLLFFGLSPSVAIATNRFGGQSNTLTLIKFHQQGLVNWRLAFKLLLPSLVGVLLGTVIVININQELFEKILGWLLIFATVITFLNRQLGVKEKANLTKIKLWVAAVLSILAGFLGGLFALSGLWFNYIYLYLGLTFKQIAGTRKVVNGITGLVSTAMFIVVGLINWPIAITMFISGTAGAWLGAHIGIKISNVWIKNIFLIIAAISAIKILFF